MSVPVAYATIVIIWSTTPLGITWSNETISPQASVLMRMSIAALVGYVLLKLARIDLVWTKRAWATYSASLLGVYAALSLTYVAAQYVPSGLISVIYALSPVISNILSGLIVGRGEFSLSRWISFAMSFFGLASIFLDDWVLEGGGLIGLLLLVLAVTLYSVSGVLVQKIKFEGHPLGITVGTLLISLPLFFLTWYATDGVLPELDWSSRSPWATLYLALFGSLLGFACYFYIVKQVGAIAVAMVTLMTPVLALALGNILHHEPITSEMVIGTVLVLLGLVCYYADFNISLRRKKVTEFTQS